MKFRKDTIRCNDRVRIISPQVFIRCGYPLTQQMLREQMTPEQLAAIHRMFEAFDIITDPAKQTNIFTTSVVNTEHDRAINSVQNTVANLLLREKRWGGPERKIYTELRPELINATATVRGRRVVKTGEYVSGYITRGYYDDYDDYEPAYLDGEKTHIILQIHTDWGSNYPSVEIEIEKCHVEKISKEITDPDHFKTPELLGL